MSGVSCSKSPTRANHGDATLSARPAEPTFTAPRGLSSLTLGAGRDGWLYVPAGYAAQHPAPLIIALHGSGGRATDWYDLREEAEARGIILLVPDARDVTWDLLYGKYGEDVAFIDLALAHTFARCRIDPDRITLLGFSDGASYALSLGTANGDLFSHLVAFSPGLLDLTTKRHGEPPIFVSHGTQDNILLASLTRDGIVPRLRRWGHEVTFTEFGGGHTYPPDILTAALDWFGTSRTEGN
ncbi:MAG: phospholipase [Gemmatimonadetes bacterium]|nr:phospholipase [Gemmatimonadota bacterium]MBT6147135.1 phospholipase [Gemmatimonadota bacterium]MBT7858882.1 phospholipase [Gemmatimonadota bacterium]